jgi:rRNA maturation endonuclease Nob1
MDNNPLKQYFRRPSVFLRLPSGGRNYKPGVINLPESGELPVFPMTAIDEITSKTPDALYNGSAVADIVKSCVPNIIDPFQITSIDMDAILIAIKSATNGNEIEIESTCPSCENIGNYGINLVNLLRTMQAPNYDQILTIDDLKIKFRPITYKQMNEASIGQFEIQKKFAQIESIEDTEQKNAKTKEIIKQVTFLTMKILSKAIDYIETPQVMVDNTDFILDFLQNCDKNIYTEMLNYNSELRSKTEIQPIDIECVNCKHNYKQMFTLNASDFFG